MRPCRSKLSSATRTAAASPPDRAPVTSTPRAGILRAPIDRIYRGNNDGQRRPQDPQGQDRDPQLRQRASARSREDDDGQAGRSEVAGETGREENRAAEEDRRQEDRLILAPYRRDRSGYFAKARRRAREGPRHTMSKGSPARA